MASFRALGLLCLVAATLAAKSSSSTEQLLALTDDTLAAALEEHPLMLVSITVDGGCEPCELYEKRMRQAQKDIRVKSTGTATLAKFTIMSQDSPVIGNIVQGQLALPKLILFREGEAMDFVGEPTKAGITEVMLREISRATVQTLKTVKQTERFLHLDSWAAQHPDEEKPPRVVGFFPSNATAGYAVFRSMARKLQGMISFGEIFDGALQKKFLGSPAKKTVVQVVKADKRERSLTYGGPLAVAPLARWVATHSLAIVQDLTTESSIEAHMARGVPVFLLLMPDEYEDSLNSMMKAFRNVAAKVRERLLFAYGFKDTEPWPQFAQSLGIDRGATGAFWMILGNNMQLTGRDWSVAWLRPPSLGFEIYAMEARGNEGPGEVTEKKLSKFVDGFLAQVDAAAPPEQWEAVEEEEVAVDEPAAAAGGGEGGAAAAAEAAATREKDLRKAIGAMEMNFNSGVANLKKVLDELRDAPQLLAGKAPGMTSTVQNLEMKLKKDVLTLKRALMDASRAPAKDEV